MSDYDRWYDARQPVPFQGFDAGVGRCRVFDAGVGLATADEGVVPPPISGGTMIVLADGLTAVSADPDRDTVWVTNLTTGHVTAVALQPGDEPGRVIESTPGVVHVALRRSGALVSIDVRVGAVLSRRSVCPAPRGLAYDANNASVLVACATGELVTLPESGGNPTRVVNVGGDLRDVVLRGSQVAISRFRSSEIVLVDGISGQLLTRSGPRASPGLAGMMNHSVAWRMVALEDAGTVVVHQLARIAAVDISCERVSAPPQLSAYGGTTVSVSGEPSSDAIVQSTASVFGVGNRKLHPADLPVRLGVLPVDVAVGPGCGTMAFASAGSSQVEVFRFTGSCANLFLTDRRLLQVPEPVAVAFAQGRLLVQSREPAGLRVFTLPEDSSSIARVWQVDFAASPRKHSGHRLFHRNTGKGIACASCHPEAQEDGQIWNFSHEGKVVRRRTPPLGGGLLSTAPYHWDGEFQGMGGLMSEVFVRRMGGQAPSVSELGAVGSWLDSVPAATAPAVSDSASVVRGKALFESVEVGCASCHSGAKLTNNATMNVGTGGAFQVPSLLGLAARAPYMHTGCAKTLRDRFVYSDCGGGDQHGHTSQLTTTQLADLTAYLTTL